VNRLLAAAVIFLVAVRSVAQPTQPGGFENEKWLAAANAAAREAETRPEASIEPVKELFRAAIAGAKGSLLMRATNDYGVFLFRTSHSDEALQVFASLEALAREKGSAEPAVRARFLYNFGQTLEGAGQLAASISNYLEAVTLDDSFDEARDAAVASVEELAAQPAADRPQASGVAGDAPSSWICYAESLFQILLSRNDVVKASALLGSLSRRADYSRRVADSYLEMLVSFLTVTRTGRDGFEKRWLPVIGSLPAQRRIADIRSAYDFERSLPLTLREGESETEFAGWADDIRGRRVFSAFLKMIGDDLGAQRCHVSSLRRYALAFSLDPSNLDAALYMANVLLAYRTELDPGGRIVDEWIGNLFRAKARAYEDGSALGILRFHTILAAIFEGQDKIGPESEIGRASYHWLRALEAERKLAGGDPATYLAPALHEKLARYYAGSGRINLALEEFLSGSAELQVLGLPDRARDVLREAEALSGPATPELRQRIESAVQVASESEHGREGRKLPAGIGRLCVEQRAWMAYFQDPKGRLSPVRDTSNSDHDQDWLGLRFSDYDGLRIRLGVLKVINQSAEAENNASGPIEVPVSGIKELLTVALFNTKRFDVIEQKRIGEVEQGLTRKDVVEPSPNAIRNAGKVLGAQYLIYATVNEWNPDRSKTSAGHSGGLLPFNLGGGAHKKDSEVAITFTLADVASGQILYTTVQRARLGEWSLGIGASPTGDSGGSVNKTAVGSAVSACANKAALEIARFLRDQRWKGTVVEVTKTGVLINAGSQQGMAPGTRLSVSAVKKIIRDRESGTVFGEDLRGIGTLEVTSVQNGFSVARIVEGSEGIKPGDRVELATVPAPPPAFPACSALEAYPQRRF
jgi:curli biogenesis system outer membrane secretion channel CsgG